MSEPKVSIQHLPLSDTIRIYRSPLNMVTLSADEVEALRQHFAEEAASREAARREAKRDAEVKRLMEECEGSA